MEKVILKNEYQDSIYSKILEFFDFSNENVFYEDDANCKEIAKQFVNKYGKFQKNNEDFFNFEIYAHDITNETLYTALFLNKILTTIHEISGGYIPEPMDLTYPKRQISPPIEAYKRSRYDRLRF